ncbi:MAG TPA: xanthine dehydrogenase family protein molybdopterin-binding subunit [Petrotogaceae bacterium]|nr:xanthine dehydrogenase family protein molybdopterin-binding subunit [Petrotogaceae bacterium]
MPASISDPVVRTDFEEKISAMSRYVDDLTFKDMLYAKTVRSQRTRAKIKNITVPYLDDGYFTVDYKDIPASNIVKEILDDQPFFANGEVNFVGEPIMLIVGKDPHKVAELAKKVVVDYEDIAPVLSYEDSLSKHTIPIYGLNNCFAEYEISRGNVEKAFAQAERVVEKTYETGYQEHIYMEPQGMIAVYEHRTITVYGSMQCPYYIKHALEKAFGWNSERIRIVQTTTGGAFGGKEEFPSIIAGHAAFAAFKTGKPVKLIYEREEDIISTTKRHPSVITIKTALDSNQKITAVDIDIKLNAGAYAGLSSVVLQRAMFCSTGVYNFENFIIKGKAYATNTVPSGAFRGFGGPQAIFAIETHMNTLAFMLHQDVIDFKSRYMVKTGDKTTTGGTFRGSLKLPEIVNRVKEMADYKNLCSGKNSVNSVNSIKKGVGFSIFLHGCGFTGNGEQQVIKASTVLKKNYDGTVSICISNVEMGQGLGTVMRKIVASSLGIDISKVIYTAVDTDKVPDSGPTVASRSTMIVGGLLVKACEKLKQRWDEEGMVEVQADYQQPSWLEWDNELLKGDAYPSYSWGADIALVSVDTLTYELSIEKIWTVMDIGIPIDTNTLRGQIEGGILQGVGYSSCEVMSMKEGRILQKNLTDYIIPSSKDSVDISLDYIINPYENGPFGAKGAGEIPFLGVGPAVAGAVLDAIKKPVYKLPLTAEYLMEVIENED